MTAEEWVVELDRRMDADPNVELAPVTVGIMRTTQIVHEAMRAAERSALERAARIADEYDTEEGHPSPQARALIRIVAERIRALAAPASAAGEDSK